DSFVRAYASKEMYEPPVAANFKGVTFKKWWESYEQFVERSYDEMSYYYFTPISVLLGIPYDLTTMKMFGPRTIPRHLIVPVNTESMKFSNKTSITYTAATGENLVASYDYTYTLLSEEVTELTGVPSKIKFSLTDVKGA